MTGDSLQDDRAPKGPFMRLSNVEIFILICGLLMVTLGLQFGWIWAYDFPGLQNPLLLMWRGLWRYDQELSIAIYCLLGRLLLDRLRPGSRGFRAWAQNTWSVLRKDRPIRVAAISIGLLLAVLIAAAGDLVHWLLLSSIGVLGVSELIRRWRRWWYAWPLLWFIAGLGLSQLSTPYQSTVNCDPGQQVALKTGESLACDRLVSVAALDLLAVIRSETTRILSIDAVEPASLPSLLATWDVVPTDAP